MGALENTSKELFQMTTVFVGGLRKSTTDDKIAAHFAKYGQAGLGCRSCNDERWRLWTSSISRTVPLEASLS